MTALTADVDAFDATFMVDDGSGIPRGQWFELDDELVEFINYGQVRTDRADWAQDMTLLLVRRGKAGTTAVSHTAGATLTAYYPDAPGGGDLPGVVAEGDDLTLSAVALVDISVAGGPPLIRLDEDELTITTPFGLTITEGSSSAYVRVSNGSPEGVVFASKGALCVDKTGTYLWRKRTNNSNTGWERVPYKGDAVALVADPATATAEDVANKINELIASLQNAGSLP